MVLLYVLRFEVMFIMFMFVHSWQEYIPFALCMVVLCVVSQKIGERNVQT